MSANPHANGGLLRKALRLPDFRDYAIQVEKPGQTAAENTRPLGRFLRDVMRLNPNDLSRLRARREHLEQARRNLRGEQEAVAG